MGRTSKKLAASAAATLVALATLTIGAGSASAASAIPNTDESCGYGSSDGNVYTCMYVNGGGNYINYATVSAEVINSGRTLQVCIQGPQGNTIGCSPFEYVPPGYTLSYTWSPHSDESSGCYWGNTWRLNSDGGDSRIGHQCAPVS